MNRESHEGTEARRHQGGDPPADTRKLSPRPVRLLAYLGLVVLAVLSILVIDGRAMQRQAQLLDEYEARKIIPAPKAGRLQSPRTPNTPRTDDDN